MAFDRFRDARTITDGTRLTADVCVVGAGAAGITITRALLRAGYRVCLLEAGGLSVDPAVDALAAVENVGIDYRPNDARMRLFGGTTNHWGGHCVPLNPIDLEARDWIDHSGWPFSFDELRPYYQAAHEVLGLGPFDYNAAEGAARIGARLFDFDGVNVATTMSLHNRVRFGLEFGDALNAARNLQCILYADVSSIDLANAESEVVRSVSVRSIAGNAFTVQARAFVIACGGIENARLLLASNQQRPAGLGNHADAVGRFFMEHIWYESGYIAPTPPLATYRHYAREVPYNDVRARFQIAIPPEKQRELRISAFRAELVEKPSAYWETWHVRHQGIDPSDIGVLLANPLKMGAALRCREHAAPDVFVLGNLIEQIPNPESRVTLSESRDPLGRPLARLNWRLSRQDHDCIFHAHEVIASEIGRRSVGRMRVTMHDRSELDLSGAAGASHHMGTTRMHIDPARGVTDAQGRVHFTRNLYVAGSSLFPTSGYANPTLTIVALALRTADALKRQLRRG